MEENGEREKDTSRGLCLVSSIRIGLLKTTYNSGLQEVHAFWSHEKKN